MKDPEDETFSIRSLMNGVGQKNKALEVLRAGLTPRAELDVWRDYRFERKPTLLNFMDFPDGSEVKNGPAMQETQVLSLGERHSLEMEMATHSSILAWTEESGRLQSRVAKSWTLLKQLNTDTGNHLPNKPTHQPKNMRSTSVQKFKGTKSLCVCTCAFIVFCFVLLVFFSQML